MHKQSLLQGLILSLNHCEDESIKKAVEAHNIIWAGKNIYFTKLGLSTCTKTLQNTGLEFHPTLIKAIEERIGIQTSWPNLYYYFKYHDIKAMHNHGMSLRQIAKIYKNSWQLVAYALKIGTKFEVM